MMEVTISTGGASEIVLGAASFRAPLQRSVSLACPTHPRRPLRCWSPVAQWRRHIGTLKYLRPPLFQLVADLVLHQSLEQDEQLLTLKGVQQSPVDWYCATPAEPNCLRSRSLQSTTAGRWAVRKVCLAATAERCHAQQWRNEGNRWWSRRCSRRIKQRLHFLCKCFRDHTICFRRSVTVQHVFFSTPLGSWGPSSLLPVACLMLWCLGPSMFCLVLSTLPQRCTLLLSSQEKQPQCRNQHVSPQRWELLCQFCTFRGCKLKIANANERIKMASMLAITVSNPAVERP